MLLETVGGRDLRLGFILFHSKVSGFGRKSAEQRLICPRVSLKLKDNVSKLGHFEVYRVVQIEIMTGRLAAGPGNRA